MRHPFRWLTLALVVMLLAMTACSSQTKAAPPMQFGINVYVGNGTDSDHVLTTKANRVFDYISGLGANSVALFFPIFTDGPHGSTVTARSKTPNTHRLGVIIDAARQHHLRVKLRPAIDQANLMTTQGQWRGTLHPANRDHWFATYSSVLKPYLQLAQQHQVSAFDVGLELTSLEGDSHWQQVVQQAKQLYKGELSYSVHWQSFTESSKRLPTSNFGINAYPETSLSNKASQTQVTAAWNKWLSSVTTGLNASQLTLDEVGIPGTPDAYKQPWEWDAAGMAHTPNIQATWFTAACTAAKQHRLRGIYFWKVDFNDDPAKANPANDPPTSFVGRPGETAIKKCM